MGALGRATKRTPWERSWRGPGAPRVLERLSASGDRLGGLSVSTVVGSLVLGWRDVGASEGDAAVEAFLVEPVDVGHGGELDVVEAGTGVTFDHDDHARR